MKRFFAIIISLVLMSPIIAQGIFYCDEEIEKYCFNENFTSITNLTKEFDKEYIADFTLNMDDGLIIKDDNLYIPSQIISENCAEDITENNDDLVDKEFVENLGFVVTANENSITLSQPYQTHRLIVKGDKIDKLDSLEIISLFDGMSVVQFDDLESTLNALDYYNSQDDIEFANPDAVVSIGAHEKEESEEVNVAASSLSTGNVSWGSDTIGFNTAFKFRMGLASLLPTVTVGIMDTGVNYSHSLVKNKISRTQFNVSDSGTVNDEYDDNGHGTHVAGIIADNTLSNVQIRCYKVLNKYGIGTLSMILNGLKQAYYDGVQVINLSLTTWSGTPIYDAQHQIYDFLEMHSVTCCVAAGNDGKDCSFLAPAKYKECITVATMDENDEIPEWSNYGECIDIIAPGVDINSASYRDDDEYISMSGTSMATPFVTAAAANVLSKNQDACPQEIKEFLQINGRDINAPAHFYGAPALYLGNIKNFTMYEQPAAPTFSLEDGVYSDSTTLTITKNKGTNIYYQIYDYSKSDKTTYQLTERTEYTGAITLDRPCIVVAVASYKSFLDSDMTQGKYYIQYSSDEGKFTIDDSGTITAYSGNSSNLVIPDEINGITVTSIGASVFSQHDDQQFVNPDETTNFLRTVTLPETCTTIENYAFFGCMYMTAVYGGNLQKVDYDAFLRCSALEHINISDLTTITNSAFAGTNLKTIDNENITSIEAGGFSGCKSLKSVNLPNLESIGSNTFSRCESLKTVNLGKVTQLNQYTFRDCCSLDTLIIPEVTDIHQYAFSDYTGPEYSVDYSYAPKLLKANECSVRSRENGICFSFSWDASTEYHKKNFSDYEYGFIYTCKNETKLIADKIEEDENNVNYNLIIKNIPKNYATNDISVKAYAYINNVCFVSDVITTNFNSINDYSQKTEFDNEIVYPFDYEHNYIFTHYNKGFYYKCADCKEIIVLQYEELPNFNDYINKNVIEGDESMYLDVVHDGIINAKDFAKIRHLSKYGW